jgi:hypothetical protein
LRKIAPQLRATAIKKSQLRVTAVKKSQLRTQLRRSKRSSLYGIHTATTAAQLRATASQSSYCAQLRRSRKKSGDMGDFPHQRPAIFQKFRTVYRLH